jgi:hypothetical protein
MTLFSAWFRCLSLVFVLMGTIAASAQAQPNSVPAAPQRPGNPAAPGAEGSSKVAPTGLAANGGAIANDVYTNTTYGFSMKLPPGWVVVPSKNPVAPSSSPREEALMQAAQVNHVLLVLTENAPMKKSTQRKSIQIVATRLLKKPVPNEGQEYLVYSKRTALEKKMPVEYLGDPTEVTIKGNKFWTIGLNQTTGQDVQHVEQYVAMQGSIMLQFLIVSPDEKGLKDMEPSIQSIDLKPVSEKPAPSRTPRKKKPATAAK